MTKIIMHKSRLASLGKPIGLKTKLTRHTRMTGRALQSRRLKMWQEKQTCSVCGCFVMYPNGFELDHIVPLYLGGDDTEDNCQILCSGVDGCHSFKTVKDLSFSTKQPASYPDWLKPSIANLTIVFGAPGSGKSSYVDMHAGKFDLVIDLDLIKSRLSGKAIYQAGDDWLKSALSIRNKMLGSLSTNDRVAWFIVSGLELKQREWWINKLKPAKVVVCDTPLDECVARIQNDSRRPDNIKIKGINIAKEWWSNYLLENKNQ